MGIEDECFFPLIKIPSGFVLLKLLEMLLQISTDPGKVFFI